MGGWVAWANPADEIRTAVTATEAASVNLRMAIPPVDPAQYVNLLFSNWFLTQIDFL
jgi:hypothetical protein